MSRPKTLVSLAMLLVGAGALMGCGSEKQASPAKPATSREKVPPVLSVGDGSRRFAIKPTREFGELCAWNQVTLAPPYSDSEYHESGGIDPENCAIEVKTILPYVVVGGRSDLAVDWAGVLGLAEKQVERVVLQLADGSREELPLKPWPNTPWSSFSFDFRPRPFPELVLAYGSEGQLLAKVNLAERIRPDCLVDEVCERDHERDRGPAINAYLGGSDPVGWFPQQDARRTYELVMGDARLKEILGAREYWVEDLGLWLTCDWKRKLGTWATVRLGKVGTFDAEWPFAQLAPDGNSYVKRAERRRVGGVRNLLAVVDLERGRLVTIDPFTGGRWINEDSMLTFSDDRILHTTGAAYPVWKGQTGCNSG
jgi:hypothetical protein